MALFRHVSKKLKTLHKWEKDIATQGWCEANLYLHTDASPMTGMASFDDTPHIEEVLRDFDKTTTWKQLLNWSTQTGKTHTMLCCWLKSKDTDPARMQWSIKNKNDVGDYLEEKIYPYLRGVKSLQEKIVVLSEEKKKKLKAASINIAGGGTTFTGTTPAERRSKSVKYYFGDEIALYDKGNFVELEGRTKAYERHFRKIMAVSSRKHKGDEMDVNYKNCDTIKEWQTYCSKCGEYFYAGSKHFKFLSKEEYLKENKISWKDFKIQGYKKEALKDIYLECPNKECKNHIDNEEKDKNIYDRKYKFIIVEGEEDGGTIGYLVNAIAVRITSFKTIASLMIDSEEEDDQDVLNQFYIDYFNEFYERKISKATENDMLLLGNELDKWVVPKDAFKIYMGVDTQKDHFWYEIKVFCYGSISHAIAWGRVETFADIEDIWLIAQHLEDESGEIFMASKMGIDRRGYNQDGVRRTDEVDEFVKYMVSKYKNGDENRIYATEGHPNLSSDKATTTYTKKDESGKRIKIDIKVIKLSNIYLKNKVNRAIERTIAKKKAETEEEEGFNYEANLFYVDKQTIDADMKGTISTSFTRQINAEVFDFALLKNGKLDTVRTWINPKQADNHIADTSVICYGFADIDNVSMERKPESGDFEDAIKGLGSLSI